MKKLIFIATLILAAFSLQNQGWSDAIFNLPTNPVKMDIGKKYLPGNLGTSVDLLIYDVPAGFDIPNNSQWGGWCMDEHINIYVPSKYSVKLYDSYSSSLPVYANDDEKWGYINYVLNHKIGANKWVGGANPVQTALWYFGDYYDGKPLPMDTDAKAMVQAALANPYGNNYVSPHGGSVAIIADVNYSSYPPQNTQLVIFEATKPAPEPGTLILLGSGLVGIITYSKIKFSHRKKQIDKCC